MATTKKENTTVEATNPTDEKMVKIRLPRVKDNPTVFVSVNERTWMIKRGEEVEVPECVAEVLRHKEEMEEEAYEFEQQTQTSK